MSLLVSREFANIMEYDFAMVVAPERKINALQPEDYIDIFEEDERT